MSKKQKLSEKEKILKEFNDGFNSVNKKDYNEMKEIYDEIYAFYHEKIIEKKEIDIKYEKIRLKNDLGNYAGEVRNYNITFYIALICAILPMYLQGILRGLNVGRKIIIMIGMIFFIIFLFSKDNIKNRPQYMMKYICMDVLADIEKEINQEKAHEEVAATSSKKFNKLDKNISRNNIF